MVFSQNGGAVPFQAALACFWVVGLLNGCIVGWLYCCYAFALENGGLARHGEGSCEWDEPGAGLSAVNTVGTL